MPPKQDNRGLVLRCVLTAVGALVFGVAVKSGYCLLMDGKLSGAEFVSFIIAFAVIGMIISFASEVSEFSVAGNIVKLKEVKKDAEKSISELKAARTETFRFLLNLTLRHPGGLAGLHTIDPRLGDFWILYKHIESFDCQEDLSASLEEAIDEFIGSQLALIAYFNHDIEAKYQNACSPEPVQLTIDALNEEAIQAAEARNENPRPLEQLKLMISKGLEEYRKLYELRKSLNSRNA